MPDRTPPLANLSEAATGSLDELRRAEFSRLDSGGHVYLDYTGGGLYAKPQLREHFELLRSGVFGNPHSLNPTSAASTELLEVRGSECSSSSRLRQRSTSRSSPRTRPGRCAWSARPTPSAQAIASC